MKIRLWARVVKVVVLLTVARLAVRFLPYRRLSRLMGAPEKNVAGPAPETVLDDTQRRYARVLGLHIHAIAQRMPFDVVCLPQAIAGRWMLRWRGYDPQIFIGAGKDPDTGEMRFHAWLMLGDLCVTGQHERDQFVALGSPAT